MTKYIPLDALLAEIEKRKKEWSYGSSTEAKYKVEAYKELTEWLDTLEVKEIDLEDSIKESLAQKYIDYTSKRHNIDPESKEGQLIYYAYMHGMNQCLTQLRIQKGE